jgi:hypothetical protein
MSLTKLFVHDTRKSCVVTVPLRWWLLLSLGASDAAAVACNSTQCITVLSRKSRTYKEKQLSAERYSTVNRDFNRIGCSKLTPYT